MKAPKGKKMRWLTRRRSKGQALVELSVLLPLFLVMIVGVVEVADSLNSYITIIDAARSGARMGSKNVATDAEIQALVVKQAERLRDPVVLGDVTVTHPTVNGAPAVRVKVCNQRSLLMNIPLIMPDSFSMCSTTTMRTLPSGPSTPTFTPANTATNTAGPSATPTPSNTPTRTNTPVPPTNTPTRTNTPVPPTNTPTRTNTPVPPTNTPTRTNTPGPATNTPTRTPTRTPTNTPTNCPWWAWWC